MRSTSSPDTALTDPPEDLLAAGRSTTDTRGSSGRRWCSILTGVATLFVFVQFFTSSEFIRAKGSGADVWTAVHGQTALGVVIPAIAAAVVAFVLLRRNARRTVVIAIALAVAAVAQTVTGNLISNAEMDAFIPFHVFFSSIVLTLAIWASVRSAARRR